MYIETIFTPFHSEMVKIKIRLITNLCPSFLFNFCLQFEAGGGNIRLAKAIDLGTDKVSNFLLPIRLLIEGFLLLIPGFFCFSRVQFWG